VGAENLCHRAILVDHASGTVAPLDPELIQVGDAVGHEYAQRRISADANLIGTLR
jgi:hypothetical protein